MQRQLCCPASSQSSVPSRPVEARVSVVQARSVLQVHKRDVMRASVMLEKGRNKFACVLAFDVPVNREAQELADQVGVKVFTADIIYHLFDQFTAYLKQVCWSLP